MWSQNQIAFPSMATLLNTPLGKASGIFSFNINTVCQRNFWKHGNKLQTIVVFITRHIWFTNVLSSILLTFLLLLYLPDVYVTSSRTSFACWMLHLSSFSWTRLLWRTVVAIKGVVSLAASMHIPHLFTRE